MAGTSPVVGVGLSVMAALTISIQVLCIRIGAEHGGIRQAVLLSMVANLVVFLPAAVVLEYPTYVVTPTSVVAFVLAGTIGTILGRILYYDSIERIGAGRTEPLKSTMPLFATVIAVVFLDESISVVHAAGIVVIAVGIAVISWETTSSDGPADVSTAALALPLLGAAAFAAEPNLVRVGYAEGTSVLVGLSLKTLAATVGFVAYLRYRGTLPTRSLFGAPQTPWYLLGAVANTCSTLAYYGALNVSRVVVVAPIVQLSPLVVAVLSFLFLQHLERITWRLLGASLLVVVGAVVVSVFA